MSPPAPRGGASDEIEVAEAEEAALSNRVRPLSIVLGSLLMLARAVAGFVFVAVSASSLTEIVGSIVRDVLADEPSAAEPPVLTELISGLLIAAFIAYLIWHTVYFFLTIAVFRGSDWARILAMSFATVSIVFAFVATLSGGEVISFRTSLYSLALDILILLALSGHDARVFSRWGRQRKSDASVG